VATVYRIHPAIGIARVGNSPTEFFIGPERVGQFPEPPGGFKDSQCRVKRQATRFRIYAHHDDGSVEEITGAVANISWTVHLVNKKATNSTNTEPAADLVIDPGTRTLNGPNQQQLFDTGTISFAGMPVIVPLGEIRSDDQNHLVVLGGFGHSASPQGTGLVDFYNNPDWHDDVSDGPVSATITLLADNSSPPVTGAWVIVAPPKFAPHQDSAITLYDRLLQVMIGGGFVAAASATSYTQHVYPILQRARDTQWVENTAGHHTWPDPVIADADRNAIFARLAAAEMPALKQPAGPPTGRLTAEQLAHMQRWKDGAFTNDWVGIPPPQSTITPDGLDRAALEACVGGAFDPGIEVGGLGVFLMLQSPNYSAAFRLDHALVNPGNVTGTLSCPWQADFHECVEHWWPVAHPNYVTRGGVAGQSWTAGIIGSKADMVDKWNKLGFVVRQGSQHVEVERCDTACIVTGPLCRLLRRCRRFFGWKS